MFFRKKYEEVRWDDHANRSPVGKITAAIQSIKPYKKSFFGIQNPRGCFNYVPNAMEIRAKIQSADNMQLQFSDLVFLIPEEEVSELAPGDSAILWLSEPGLCFKVEKKKLK